MKKFIVLLLSGVCISFFAKAQTSDPSKLLRVDTIKASPDNGVLLKKLPSLTEAIPQILKPDAVFKPFITLANQLGTLDNMPIAKASSTDHIPVLKLGDTKTTHFTMLVKPVSTMPNKAPIAP